MNQNFILSTKRLNFRPFELGDEEYTFPEVDEDLTKYYNRLGTI